MSNQVQSLEGTAITADRPKAPLDVFRDTMTKQRGEFMKVLPQHISFEKFQRTVMTAIITQPDLLKADRQSLLVSCIKSATDGLLPDGRDAALVVFNSKAKDDSGKDVWIKRIQYLPMYAGILKKVRQSGDILSVVTHVVYQKDKFEYVLGDDERIVHEPYIGEEERGKIIAAYCIAKLKDSTVVREVMTFQDIEKVRRTSKSGAMNENDLKYNKQAKVGDPKGIWASWYEEMARKTVFRRTAKWLPQQIEIVDQAFSNDSSMEILDSVSADESILIEDQSQPAEIEQWQPDIKQEVEKARESKKEKRASKPVEKPEVVANKEEEKQSSGQNVSQETPKPAQGMTTLEEIEAAISGAKDGNALYDIWTADFEDDLKAIKKNNPQEYARLFDIYQAAAGKFQE